MTKLHFSALCYLYQQNHESYRGGEVAGGLGLGGGHEGEVLDDLLSVLCLPGAGLSSAEDALVLAVWN